MKRYCRYKGIACEFATEYGYCQLTGCVKWHERSTYVSITTSEEMGNAFIEIFKPILKEENDG